MDFFRTLLRWREQIGVGRVLTFARFLARRFIDDRLFESAGALAYTTLFALVPLSAVAMATLAAFPVFEIWTQRLVDFVFATFVPDAAQVVAGTLKGLADSARQLSLKALVVLLASALLTMLAIENTFDRIWRVAKPRATLWRLVVYWTLLTLGVGLAATSLAASAWLSGLPLLADAGAMAHLHRLIPSVVALLVFTAAYLLIPHRPVALRFALVGGLLATALFELAKAGFSVYLRNTNFELLYGALAVIPIFLIWIWVSWLVVLLGACVAASLSAFRYQPPGQRLPPGAELYACLRLLARLEESRRHGRGLDTDALRRIEPALTDDICESLLSGLADLGVTRRGVDGEWLPVRDLATVTLGDLHERLGLRLPPAGLLLPGADDVIGRAAVGALTHLRKPLDAALRHPVSHFIALPPEPC